MGRILYSLQDLDLNELELNPNTEEAVTRESITLGSDQFTFENKIVEKSGQPGSVKLGLTRIQGRNLQLNYMRTAENISDFRLKENTLLSFMKKAEYLIDKEENKKIKIAMENYSAEYDPGTYQHFSSHVIEMTALNPFWESVSESMISDSVLGASINDILISTDSYLETPPTITLTAASACSSLQIYVSETKRGIEILDPIFGTSGFEVLIIDNENGTVKIGSLDRSQFISASTGYFKLPEGQSTLKIVPTVNLDIDITWRKRTFV